MSAAPLLQIEHLNVGFDTAMGAIMVVRDLDLVLEEGETLCIVGESGSGKSMTALAIMGLVPEPLRVVGGGSIKLSGEELVGASHRRLRQIRGKRISMVFQEPMSSLNPVFSVGEQIAETLRLHEGLGRRDARAAAIEMLQAVGIPAPERRVDEYPHQMSGGMRQRVMIAMALVCRPAILIADEPTTALDVTVQAQIMDLLKDVQRRFGTAILLITHDIGIVAEAADRVIVLYAGRRVEEGSAEEVLRRPAHPYTAALVACAPQQLLLGGERRILPEIPGIVPSLLRMPPGCAFAPRCARATAECHAKAPPLLELSAGRASACWLATELGR